MTENEQLAERLIKWVEEYALRVNPPGCLPTPTQDREITMFAAIVRALRGLPISRDKIDTSDIPEVGEEFFKKAKLRGH
jgi:hypothetical protein